ncbi:MAG: transcriptional regulator [Symploca sp. SIO3E6]|nr:transcriptional regulator [Caldora sp. SIO3E6]
MSITLTKTQEQFIQDKLRTGKYRSAEEVLEVALRLLDEYDCAESTLSEQTDSEWLSSVRGKIDAAIAVSEHTPPIDGETFISDILERLQQARETQTRKAILSTNEGIYN